MQHPLRPPRNPRAPYRIDPETHRKQRPGQERIEPPAHLLRRGRDGFEVVVGVPREEGREDEREEGQEGEGEEVDECEFDDLGAELGVAAVSAGGGWELRGDLKGEGGRQEESA